MAGAKDGKSKCYARTQVFLSLCVTSLLPNAEKRNYPHFILRMSFSQS